MSYFFNKDSTFTANIFATMFPLHDYYIVSMDSSFKRINIFNLAGWSPNPAGLLSRQQSLEESPSTVSYLELNFSLRLQPSFVAKTTFNIMIKFFATLYSEKAYILMKTLMKQKHLGNVSRNTFSTGSLFQLGLEISTTQSAAWPEVKKSRQSRPSIMLRIRRDIAQTCNPADNRLRPGRETATWREAGRRQL